MNKEDFKIGILQETMQNGRVFFKPYVYTENKIFFGLFSIKKYFEVVHNSDLPNGKQWELYKVDSCKLWNTAYDFVQAKCRATIAIDNYIDDYVRKNVVNRRVFNNVSHSSQSS